MIETQRKTSSNMKYQLSARDTYIKGNPIMIKFSLQNLSNENLWVLKWYTPFEGLRGKIFLVTCDGKEIPYEGPMSTRSQPKKADYIHIDPGRSVSAEVDMSNAYKFPVCNQTIVQFKGRIYDYTTSLDSTPKSTQEHQMIYITGNSVTFRVVSP
jgi:hypothetical protein